MKSKGSARILLVSTALEATLYNLMLKPTGHETRMLAFAEEDHFRYQSTILSTHEKKILKTILDFRPHLIVMSCEEDIDEFLVRLKEAFKEGDRPSVVVVAAKDTWCFNADVCLSGPVDPNDLLQTVENLLQKMIG